MINVLAFHRLNLKFCLLHLLDEGVDVCVTCSIFCFMQQDCITPTSFFVLHKSHLVIRGLHVICAFFNKFVGH